MSRSLMSPLPGYIVVFDAVVELLCLFPSDFHLSLPFGLKVFELLAQKLVVILAFFDDFSEMVLFILG